MTAPQPQAAQRGEANPCPHTPAGESPDGAPVMPNDLGRQRVGEVLLRILRNRHPEVEWKLVGEDETPDGAETSRPAHVLGTLTGPQHQHPVGKKAA